MTRIAVKHGKTKLSNFAIFHFFLPAVLFVSSLTEVACCDLVKQKVGGWNFDCLFDSGCLSLEQQVFVAQSSMLPNASEIAENRTSGMIDLIGTRITCGIVESRKALSCMACFGNTIVDLPALIATNIDQELTTDDVYWQYYADCDRWQVTFNNQLIIPNPVHWTQDVIQRCRQMYLMVEFVAIENLPNGRLVSGNSHRQPACSDRAKRSRSLTSWLAKLDDQPLVYYWNSLSAMHRNDFQNGLVGLALNQLLDQLKTASAQPQATDVSTQ